MELGQLMDCCPMVYLGEGKAMHTAGEKDFLCHDVISFKSCFSVSSSNYCANGLLCCSFNKTHTLNLKGSPITGSECLLPAGVAL